MSTWSIILIVYGIFLLTTILLLVPEHKKSQGGDSIWVVLATCPLLAIIAPVIVYMYVKQRYDKTHPARVPEKLRKAVKPYCVLDKPTGKIMTIVQYNHLHNTKFTLEQVYGKKYVSQLDPDLLDELDTDLYIVEEEESLPNDEYRDFANRFIRSRKKADYTPIADLIDENIVFTLYGNRTIHGKQAFLDYWADRSKRDESDKVQIKATIKVCNYNNRLVVKEKPHGYKAVYHLIQIVDGKVQQMVMAPFPLQDIGVGGWDFDNLPYSKEFIEQNKGDEIPAEEQMNKMPCLKCGRPSHKLQWFRFFRNGGLHGYGGPMSFCPDCGCMVEFAPDIRMRYKEPIKAKPFVATPPAPDSNVHLPEVGNAALYFNEHVLGEKFLTQIPEDVMVKPTDEHSLLYGDEEWYRPMSLRQCVAEFNTELIADMQITDPENYHLIKQLLWQAFDEGNAEAGNSLAVLLSNYEGKQEEGKTLWKSAADAGSKNAMRNYYTALCNEEKYQEATDYLRSIEARQDVSIRCLWVLATMYLRGDSIKYNLIAQDIEKAKGLLKRIAEMTLDNSEEDADKVKRNAVALLNRLDESNLFAMQAHDFHKYAQEVKGSDFSFAYNHDLSRFLPHLKFDGEVKVYLAQEIGSGDTSCFYVGDSPKPERYQLPTSEKEFHAVKANISEEAAWEFVLLLTSPGVMSVFWHGGYERREYIYCPADLDRIVVIDDDKPLFRTHDISNLKTAGILPSVKMDGNIADVTFSYWNDWEGLIRNTIRIKWNGDRIASAEFINKEILYKFKCDLLF